MCCVWYRNTWTGLIVIQEDELLHKYNPQTADTDGDETELSRIKVTTRQSLGQLYYK